MSASPAGPAGAGAEPTPDAPVIRVERGAPTAEEIGALVAILAAASGGAGQPPERAGSRWAAPTARLGAVGPGRGNWRHSGMPR